MFAMLSKRPQAVASATRAMSAVVQSGTYENAQTADMGHFAIKFSENDQRRLSNFGFMKPAMGGAGSRKDKSLDVRRDVKLSNVHLQGTEVTLFSNIALKPLHTHEESGKEYHNEIPFGELTDRGAQMTADFVKRVKRERWHYALSPTTGHWNLTDQKAGTGETLRTVNCIGFALEYLSYLASESIAVEPTATPDRAFELLTRDLKRIKHLLVDEGVITNERSESDTSAGTDTGSSARR